MKQFCFFLLVLFSGFTLFGQVDTTLFRNPINYPLAVAHYSNLYGQSPTSAYYPYQVACYLALQVKADSAFIMLNRAIDNGATAEDIYTDTDFETLYSQAGWSEVDSRLKKQFLDKNQGITHPVLAIDLWLLGIEDQRYRALSKNHKKTETRISDNWRERVVRVEEIVKQYGWPKISMVGDDAAQAAFLIIQHSDQIKRYLPQLIAAAKQDEAKKVHAAMMIDRYLTEPTSGLFKRKRVQIYGTQFTRDAKMDKSTGQLILGPMTYHPIADPENLEARRHYIGKGSFKDDCEHFGVEYPGVENMDKSIKIKNSWIKKGYLLGFEEIK